MQVRDISTERPCATCGIVSDLQIELIRNAQFQLLSLRNFVPCRRTTLCAGKRFSLANRQRTDAPEQHAIKSVTSAERGNSRDIGVTWDIVGIDVFLIVQGSAKTIASCKFCVVEKCEWYLLYPFNMQSIHRRGPFRYLIFEMQP